MKVDLLTKRACPQCTQAEQVLRELQSELDLDLSIIDAEADSFLYSRHRYDLPVIRLDGRIVSRRTGDPQEIARRLRHAHRMKEARRVDRHVAAGGQTRRVVQVNMADVAQGAQGSRPLPTASLPSATVGATPSEGPVGGVRQVVRVDMAELLGAPSPEVVQPPGRATRAEEAKKPIGEPLPPLRLPAPDAQVTWAPGFPGRATRRKLAHLPGVEGVEATPFFGAVAVWGTDAGKEAAKQALGPDAPPRPPGSALLMAAGALLLGAASAWAVGAAHHPLAGILAVAASLLPLLLREGRWLVRDLPLVGALPLVASASIVCLAWAGEVSHLPWAAAPAAIHLGGLAALLWARRRVRASLGLGELPVEPGQQVEVGEGVVIPVDGALTSMALIDERPLGGEEGMERGPGELAYAGSIAQQDLSLVVSAATSRRAIASTQALLGLAASGGGKLEALSTAAIPLAGLAAAVGVGILVDPASATAVLVGMPALALALALPLADAAALTMALRKGIGAKSAEVLHRAGSIRSVVVGKRSMLERGVPAFLGMKARQHHDPGHLLKLAAAAETGLDSPIARSIASHAKELGAKLPTVDERRETPGAGVEATIEGERVLLGSMRWLGERGVDLGPLAAVGVDMGRRGSTPIFLAVDGAAAAVLELGAFPAEAARQTIGSLELAGVDIRVATGDGTQSARWLAEAVGLDPAAAKGDLLGQEKRALLDEVDRPVLVAAGSETLGALQEGADLLVESSERRDAAFAAGGAFLIRPGPRGITDLIRTGRTARRGRRLALAVSVGAAAASVALAAAGALVPAGAAGLALAATVVSLAAAASPWVALR